MRRNHPLVITLCGSTRFKETFEEWNRRLTLAGAIVLMPGVWHHYDGNELNEEDAKMAQSIHRHKILMSDLIFIINKDNYIGENTKEEIKFADSIGIPIIYCYNENNEEKELPI